MDHQFLALAIRWLHVAGMAAILGGAVLVWWLTLRATRTTIAEVAVRYEQVFWAAFGVVVMTGVGNLGAFGPSLPAPSTDWGGTFVAKITFVAILAALSLPRSIVVARIADDAGASLSTLRGLYGATAVAVAVIAALAVWLAHA